MGQKVQMSEGEFRHLSRVRATLELTVVVIVAVLYYGFILMIAFDKPLFATIMLGHYLSFGILAGIGITVFVFLLNGLYALIASLTIDPIIAQHTSKETSHG